MKAVKRRSRVRADVGPPERGRHDELVAQPTSAAGVVGRRVKHACRLDWYWDKASLDDRQHSAGLRFRRDWLLAVAAPKLIGTYGPRVGAAHEAFHDLQLEARRRVAKALVAVGRDLTPVLIDVCGHDEWASGRLPRLRDALTVLGDHYGMPRASRL